MFWLEPFIDKDKNMPVVTFANTKGGAGKTTAVLVMASELASRGHRVTILDADPHGWLARWALRSPRFPQLSVHSVTDETIEAATLRAKKRGGYILIDRPPARDAVLARAIGLADHVIIPVQGCAMDAQGGAEVLDLLAELDRSCGIRIEHSVLLTRVNAAISTRALTAAREALAARGVRMMQTSLTERAAYRDVFDHGGLLHNLEPADVSNLGKDIENAAQLTGELLTLMPQRMPRPQARKVTGEIDQPANAAPVRKLARAA